jgi:hypothetical protein
MPMCFPDTADWGCALSPEEVASLNPEVKYRSEMLAWQSLQRLTGFRIALCQVTVRPCAARCNPGVYMEAPVTGFPSDGPYISGGRWYNACGCTSADSCSCGSISEVILPVQEAGGPIVVKIDGGVLDSSAYRVDNGNRLVRQDGGAWPICQNQGIADGEEGTFSVSYYPGLGPDDALNFAAGLLAVEWYKACNGKECRLPSGATRIQRQGINFEVPSDMFASGISGIREVDAIVSMYNPYRLTTPSAVFSPDRRVGRIRTA